MSTTMNRRGFIGLLGASSLLTVSSKFTPVLSAVQKPKIISLYNIHTDEKLVTCFWNNGEYCPEALKEINNIMRDFRTGQVRKIDPKLIDYLHRLVEIFDYEHLPINLLSGYRSKKTNNMLRRKSRGVAKNSFHIKGRAMDFNFPEVELKHLRKAALKYCGGGVGYYSKSNFIHIDTGKKRSWGK